MAGVGTEKGAPIPIKRNGIVESYKDENNEVITQRNPQVLTSIANRPMPVILTVTIPKPF